MGFELEGDILIGYEDEPGVTNAVIPDTVRIIAARAFFQSRIASVVIPESVEYITGEAFSFCEHLVKVTLPKKNIAIEDHAFSLCSRFTANLSIREWDPLFGLPKALYAKSYMNNYDANDPHYELYHEKNSHYIRLHLDKIIRTLNSSDVGVVSYLTREKMLGLNRTNRLLDIMSGNIEAAALLLDYKHDAFPAEYLERYERENTEKELGLRERTLADWRRIFKLVSDGSGGWGIAKYRGSDAIVVIPEKINNKPVTGILYGAFDALDVGDKSENYCRLIEEVILPDTITVIEDRAFDSCLNLKSVTLPNCLERIGNYAFADTGLTSITMPNSVTHIGEYSFNCCDDLEKAVLSENLKEIGLRAFENCEKLATIIIPASVSEMDVSAFIHCSSLTEAVIQSHIDKIPYFMFSDCVSLKKVTLPDTLSIIEKYAFNGCRSLAAIDIPNGVTEIQEYAFEDCSALTSVTLPDSLITLGDGVFSECTQLMDITIPPSIDYFGNRCFEGTAWLNNQTDDFVICGNGVLIEYTGNDRDVTIPAGVAKIGEGAFEDNVSITSVTIPEGVVEITYEAFCNCCCLAHVTLPQSLKVIGSYAFCKTALCEITIPEGVEIIDSWAFSETPLRSVTIPQSVQVIGYNTFLGCTQLAEVDLPENLPVIRPSAFEDTPYLENLPDDFVIFGDELYRYKGKSPKVIVPDNIKVIGMCAFYSDPYVTEIVIPDSVTEIGEDAFANCEKLELIVLPDTLTKLYYFDITYYNETLKIRYKGDIYGYDDLNDLCALINSEENK